MFYYALARATSSMNIHYEKRQPHVCTRWRASWVAYRSCKPKTTCNLFSYKLARNPSSINIVYKETGAYDFYALARTTCSLLKT